MYQGISLVTVALTSTPGPIPQPATKTRGDK
jgi:hypothetical protein